MILKLPIQKDRHYLTASEIRELNEWCARLAQLQLLGATLEDHTETVTTKHGETRKQTLDEVPEPFVEPPVVKCEKCGNDEIRKFGLVYYERQYRALRGFNKKGDVGVRDDPDYNDISRNDPIEAVRPFAGEWLKCDHCQHEQRPDVFFEW
jgi:hypothetical protein